MDPIYNNCYNAVNTYTARVFNSTHAITQFNKSKATVKVEVVKETVIPAEKVRPVNVTPAVEADVKEDVKAVVNETAVVEAPVVKKKTTRKKKTVVEE